MTRYMIKGTYSPDGIQGVMKSGGTARVDAIDKMVAGLGGSMEAFYFALGEDDVYVIVDAPSIETMLAVAGAVKSTGVLRDYQTVVLVTPEQVDDAMNVEVDYTPPGG